VEVVVTKASLDYGDGAIVVKWSAVDSIRVTSIDDSTRPQRSVRQN
jgi:hypothetical protein